MTMSMHALLTLEYSNGKETTELPARYGDRAARYLCGKDDFLQEQDVQSEQDGT